MKLRPSVKIALASCALLAFLAYCVVQRQWLTKSFYTFTSDKVPNGFDGFKICHISDFHNHVFGEDNSSLVRAIKDEAPDIIVITGDLIDSRHTNIDISLDFVEQCVAIAPVYYVNGNHEEALAYEVGASVYASLEEMGVTVFDGDARRIYRGNESINIGGFSNTYDNGGKDYGIFDDSSKLGVLLYHRPTHFELFKDAGADLVFSGHAHGGQVRIPFVGGLISPDQGLFPKYTEGMHDVDGIKLVISRGLGNSRIPIRINNRPELVFVTLKKPTN